VNPAVCKQNYWRRIANARVAAGLTTRGTVRKYRRWVEPGLPRFVRARMTRRYTTLAAVMDRVAGLLAQAQCWLPVELRRESTVLASELATIKRHNSKRKVRIK
jgi:hypothetical protein